MPAPAMMTVREEAKSLSSPFSPAARRSGRFCCRQGAVRGPGGMRIEARIMAKQGGAIGADGFGRVAHIDENMRMVERWHFAHAHEFARPDLDHRHAGAVVKMRNDVLGHARSTPRRGALLLLRGTIAIRVPD